MIRRIGSVALIHLVLNALIVWLGYYWLGVGETRASTLAWSGFLAALLALMVCWTYGASFTVFQSRTIRSAWRGVARHSLWLLLAAVAIAMLYYVLALWEDYSGKPALTVASYLTLKLRKPVTPAGVSRVLQGMLFVVRWMIVPVFVLPMLAAIAARGRRGFEAFGSYSRRWLYWIEVPVLLLCAFAVPFKLVGWIPEEGSFKMEAVSFALRGAGAYLLFCVAWLLLAFVTSRGMPVLTQAKTADSP